MNHHWLGVGAVMGFLAVIAGTFAAHGLDEHLSPRMLEVFETGVRYHMYHALVILVTAGVSERVTTRMATIAATFFLVGIIFFSGSLYLLAISETSWLGMIAPVGGVGFLAGWGTLVVAAGQAARSQRAND